MSAKKNWNEMYFLGNVSALEAPSIPLLWLNRLLVTVDTAAVLSNGTALVLCSSCVALPCAIGDAIALFLDDSRDARRRQETGAHEPDICCYAMG
jgi:hypothetical protein